MKNYPQHFHVLNVCQYGTVHTQCRCRGTEDKVETSVLCPTPQYCGMQYQPKHRKEELPPREVLVDADQAGHVWHSEDRQDTSVLPAADDTTTYPKGFDL